MSAPSGTAAPEKARGRVRGGRDGWGDLGTAQNIVACLLLLEIYIVFFYYYSKKEPRFLFIFLHGVGKIRYYK